MSTGWAAAGVTVDPGLEDGDAGGSWWASVALAAGELHGTVMPTPGLWAPADIACHSVFTRPTMEARLRQAFVHIFLTCQAFRRDQVKAQHSRQESSIQGKAYMPCGTGISAPSDRTNSQRISHGPLSPWRLESKIPLPFPCLVDLHAPWIQSPKHSLVSPFLPRHLSDTPAHRATV